MESKTSSERHLTQSNVKTAERTGAQILCEALIREGVTVMFGIPGGTVMPFYHAMFEYRDKLRHVLCRHEQGAGHAAEGYARAGGKLGVCIGTSGPGATNLVTPIADAWMDSTPLLAITGQVMAPLIGTDAFQETDITGITLPITKHNYLVKNVEDIPRVVKEAVYIATSGRTGPVHIDITKDCQQARCIPNWDVSINLPGYRTAVASHNQSIQAAIDMLYTAKRPLMMVGNGVIQSGASTALLAFAERSNIPVVTTLQGLGAFPQSHPLSLGMPGMHGLVHVNKAIQACDVLLSIGARFDDRVTGKVSTFAPNAKVIHVDIDISELNKLVYADVAIHGDARGVLEALLLGWPSNAPRIESNTEWLAQIEEIKTRYQHRSQYARQSNSSVLMPYDVYDALNTTLQKRGKYRVVTDVGQHQMWAAQLLDWSIPRSHITSGGSGTMGFSVPAALGIAIAKPDETVWVICGDGGFQMTNQEIATMRQEGIRNVKIAVINNGYLGMVRQWQELFEGKRYSNTPLSGPDFAQLGEAYGARGIRVERVEDVQFAIDTAYAHDGVVVVDFRVEKEVNVFPMVPQGNSIGEMLIAEQTPASDVNLAHMASYRAQEASVQ